MLQHCNVKMSFFHDYECCVAVCEYGRAERRVVDDVKDTCTMVISLCCSCGGRRETHARTRRRAMRTQHSSLLSVYIFRLLLF